MVVKPNGLCKNEPNDVVYNNDDKDDDEGYECSIGKNIFYLRTIFLLFQPSKDISHQDVDKNLWLVYACN